MERPKNKIWDVKARRLELVNDTYLGYIVLMILCAIWFFASKNIKSELILPSFEKTAVEFLTGWTNKRVMTNFWITLKRVLLGVGYAIVVGTIIGIGMGYSKKVYNALSPIINSIRQIPIMTWVPLSIIWFGLGEGPTIFLIFMSAVFPLTINVIDGVANIDQNLVYASRSMGASLSDIIRDIILPGAFPSFLTGVRLAIGGGWQSVI
ncbi:MAG: ABC transporter permease [Lachnospiraceae bacterium]|nr:ABC transporter permease [Lachnospiraceae bacterium]